MANECEKLFDISSIRKMQLETVLKFNLILVSMCHSKNKEQNASTETYKWKFLHTSLNYFRH